MDSADFCSNAPVVAVRRAVRRTLGFCGTLTVSSQTSIRLPSSFLPHLEQISPDKGFVNCPAATVSFTVPLEPEVSLCCANSPRDLSLL
jgi:hypothetical protein